MRRSRATRTHTDFVPVSGDACRRCAELIRPPIDPRASVEILRAAEPGRWRSIDPVDWVERLDPTHPIRRYPERYGILTREWLLYRARMAA
jgi:hypothetical protein